MFIVWALRVVAVLAWREGGMSVTKLLLSGLMVASGLILGAFTLHARFAPEWEVQASAAGRPDGRPLSADVPQMPDRTTASDVPDNWAPRLIKSDPRPPAVSDVEAAKAKKKLADKKPAEKRQKPDTAKPEQQTVFSWLTGLLKQ
jgi:hypothetical protein